MFKIIYQPSDRTNDIDINKYIKVGTRPIIPTAEEIVNEIKLGDGTTYYNHTGNYKEREIELECNFVAKSKTEWMEHCRIIQEYFKGGKGKLILPNDDNEVYWNVKHIEIDISDRWMGIGTHLDIKFTVDPYRYLREYENGETYDTHAVFNISSYNFYEPSKPIIRLYYESNVTDFEIVKDGDYSTLFELENPFVNLTPLYIDIDVEERVLRYYYQDGTTDTHTENTNGDFDNLIIPNGSSTFSIESNYICNIEVYRRYRKL